MVGLISVALAFSAGAAELRLDFADVPEGEVPPGFRNALAGEGKPADWRIEMGDVPLLLAPLSPQAPQTARRPVLTQADRTPGRERFPLLVYEEEEFGDFKLTTRFRILGGEDEQMAGIAFRLQDERNFYVIRASALGKNLRYYKVVEGQRSDLIGPSMDIPTNVWHELTIECRGNEILCWLNGHVALPALQDFSFGSGKLAFWTMSDSICEFAEVRIQYTPQIPLSQSILTAALEKYSRVRDLRLYTLTDGGETVVVASKNEECTL